MTDDADLDAICLAYLERLRDALAGLPSGDRRQIIDQVSEHISSARAALALQTEAAVREILERLGNPQEIAASAALEGGDSSRPNGRNPIVIGAAVAVVLVVIGVGIAAIAGAFNRGESPSVQNILPPPTSSSTVAPVSTVIVPTVMGQQLAAATRELGTAGLSFTAADVASNQPTGTVLVQDPSGGTRVDRGSRISLKVSGTQLSTAVPDTIGQSQAQALESLSHAGLETRVLVKAGGTSVVGIVTSQSPAAGSVVVAQSIVALTVSS
jgi:hypothetical protein